MRGSFPSPFAMLRVEGQDDGEEQATASATPKAA